MLVKSVRELQPGDVVVAATGKPLTVSSVNPGLRRGSILVCWREQVSPPWSCVGAAAEVSVVALGNSR